MKNRKICIYHSITSQKEYITTNVDKWGDLKRLISTNIGDKTCVLSGSKHVLAVDDALLPEGDLSSPTGVAFTIFLYPKESKGGMTAKKKKAAKKMKKTAKKAKPAKKKAVRKASPALASSESVKIDLEQQLRKEAEAISGGLKGFR